MFVDCVTLCVSNDFSVTKTTTKHANFANEMIVVAECKDDKGKSKCTVMSN